MVMRVLENGAAGDSSTRRPASDSPTEPESVPSPAPARGLGGTGVIVSPIAIDGAAFGWAAGIDEAANILDVYVATGGNLISTADHYSGGRSEIMIGSWLRSRNDRTSVTIETRVGRHPDASGLSKRSILRAVENSLTRLGTDYVDFLALDGEHPETPIEESLETCARLISEGKVRFISAAGFSAEAIREVDRLSQETSLPKFRAVLVEYNLMDRTAYEDELQQVAVDMGHGALARLPLASGYLTGQFRSRDDRPSNVMFDDAIRHVGRRGERVLAALNQVAAELDESIGNVALAWVLVKPGITAAVLRARDSEQVANAISATGVRLSRQQVALLDHASAS